MTRFVTVIVLILCSANLAQANDIDQIQKSIELVLAILERLDVQKQAEINKWGMIYIPIASAAVVTSFSILTLYISFKANRREQKRFFFERYDRLEPLANLLLQLVMNAREWVENPTDDKIIRKIGAYEKELKQKMTYKTFLLTRDERNKLDIFVQAIETLLDYRAKLPRSTEERQVRIKKISERIEAVQIIPGSIFDEYLNIDKVK